MANPFEEETGSFLVLVNAVGQYSLWPRFRDLPAGWTAAGMSGERKLCLEWIESNWTDLRPKSLIDATARGTL